MSHSSRPSPTGACCKRCGRERQNMLLVPMKRGPALVCTECCTSIGDRNVQVQYGGGAATAAVAAAAAVRAIFQLGILVRRGAGPAAPYASRCITHDLAGGSKKTPEEVLRALYQRNVEDELFAEDLRVRIPGDPEILPWYAANLHSREAFKQHFAEMLEVVNIKSAEPATIIVGPVSNNDSGGGSSGGESASGTGAMQAAVVVDVHMVHKKTGKELRYSPCEVWSMVGSEDEGWKAKTLDVYVDTAALERLQEAD